MITTTYPYRSGSRPSLIDQVLIPKSAFVCHECIFRVPLVSSIPDNAPLIFVGSFYSGTIVMMTALRVDAIDIVNPAIELKAQTGLGVGVLASIAGVSRQGYYEWLSGSGIALENRERLERLVITFRAIRREREDLVHFLSQETPQGKIADLLSSGREDIVLAISSRGNIRDEAPDETRSPWTTLAARLRGITHNDGSARGRRRYSGTPKGPAVEDHAVVKADTRPPRRRKRPHS